MRRNVAIGDCTPAQRPVIPGGAGTRPLLPDHVINDWIRSGSDGPEVTMSVCTGAFLLAKAGILDACGVTTRHGAVGELRRLAPNAVVDPGARYHDNGRILTAAAISAGIDCSLHLVGRLLGDVASAATAAYMEYERRR
jgi:transcriptional regulator GlxA family with amidase domain